MRCSGGGGGEAGLGGGGLDCAHGAAFGGEMVGVDMVVKVSGAVLWCDRGEEKSSFFRVNFVGVLLRLVARWSLSVEYQAAGPLLQTSSDRGLDSIRHHYTIYAPHSQGPHDGLCAVRYFSTVESVKILLTPSKLSCRPLYHRSNHSPAGYPCFSI